MTRGFSPRKEFTLPQKKISLRIDGELVNTLEGQTILEAARASGKSIPTLCFLEGLIPPWFKKFVFKFRNANVGRRGENIVNIMI